MCVPFPWICRKLDREGKVRLITGLETRSEDWRYKVETHQLEMSNEEKDSGVVFDHRVIMNH